MNEFQTHLQAEKQRGFDACKRYIEQCGKEKAKERVSYLILPTISVDQTGYWRGWLQACVSDSIVGA